MKKILFIILFLAICFKAYASPLHGDLNLQGDVTIANGCWELVSETDVTTPITDLTISGLSGDTDEVYKINLSVVGTASSWLKMIINGDVATNYGFQSLYADSTTLLADRNARAYWYSALMNTATVGKSSIIFHAKSGSVRSSILTLFRVDGVTVTTLQPYAQAWNNSVDEVTSITFTPVSGNIGTGSHIELWRKRS